MPTLARSLTIIGSRICPAVLVAVLALGGSGCAPHQRIRAGTAFSPDAGTSIGSKPFLPGKELGWLYLYLDDTSKSALVLNSLKISGPGVGTVVRAVEVKVAPLRSGYHQYHYLDAVPGGTYMTDPPVSLGGKGCHKQALFPLPGHRLTPGSQVRIHIVLRTVRPGKWSVRHQLLYYTQDGIRYRQAIPIRFWGSVADNVPDLRFDHDPGEAVCVRPTGTRVLPGWHLPKNLKEMIQHMLK